MSTSAPALPPLWWPGLAAATDGLGLRIDWSEQRPEGAQVYITPAQSSAAQLDGEALHLAVAPADQQFALALIRAFAAPAGRPAAQAAASLDLLALAGRVTGSMPPR